MSWMGWVAIGIFVVIAALMGYMVWIIYQDDKRRDRK